MKTTTSIKIVTVTLVLLVAGCFLSMLTIKNYNPFNGGFLTALCANVCILCCEIDRKKREDAEAKNASDNISIRETLGCGCLRELSASVGSFYVSLTKCSNV